jgi:hypothetical protein
MTLETRRDDLDSAGNLDTTAHYPQRRRAFRKNHGLQIGSCLSRSSTRLLFAVTLTQFAVTLTQLFLADLFLKRIISTQVRKFVEIFTGVGVE